jgi:hypothetical protein
MTKLIPVLLNFLIIGLFLYSKLLPFKDKLNSKYRKIFDFFNRIFYPVFNSLKNVFKPLHVGAGLSVDMTQIILLIILLLALNIF